MAAAARNAADRALLACAATICATTEVGRAVREWAEVRVFLSGWAIRVRAARAACLSFLRGLVCEPEALGSNLTGGPLVAPVRDDAGHSGRSRAVGTSYTMCTEGPRPLGARGGHGQPW